MPQVQVIAPLHVSEPAKLRVCAYARVSSDSADQLNSFASAVRRGQVDDVFVTRLSQLSHKACRLRCILRLLHRKRVRLHTTESDLRYDLYRHGLDGVLS